MTYPQLAYLHLATVIPAFFIAAFLPFNQKGTGGTSRSAKPT